MNDSPPAARRSGAAALAVRLAVTTAQRLRGLLWFFTRPVTFGVRAIPVTPDGRVVLVRHSYIAGWHLPGGGLKRDEDKADAALRELSEEIGMTAHGEIRYVADFTHQPNFRQDRVSLFLVQDVEYRPRLSLEIEEIAAFPPGDLPPDTAASTRRRIAEWTDGIESPPLW